MVHSKIPVYVRLPVLERIQELLRKVRAAEVHPSFDQRELRKGLLC